MMKTHSQLYSEYIDEVTIENNYCEDVAIYFKGDKIDPEDEYHDNARLYGSGECDSPEDMIWYRNLSQIFYKGFELGVKAAQEDMNDE